VSGDLPCYVLDASIAGKWFLKDEEFTTEAERVRQDYRDNIITLIAPDHIRYEVPSLIRNALSRARIQAGQAARSIDLFLSLDLQTVSSNSLIRLAYDRSLYYGCNLYDGLHVALSEAAGCPLLHADNRLRRTLQGRLTGELWIEDYGRRSWT
jgi:predicted nucleic acid-binding protein